jgi:hypothetical protein
LKFIVVFSASLAAPEGGGLHLGQEVLRSPGHPPSPPVLLWLAGIPIPLVILIMLLH